MYLLHEKINGYIDESWMRVWMNGWMNRCMVVRMNLGWVCRGRDGQMDRKMHGCLDESWVGVQMDE